MQAKFFVLSLSFAPKRLRGRRRMEDWIPMRLCDVSRLERFSRDQVGPGTASAQHQPPQGWSHYRTIPSVDILCAKRYIIHKISGLLNDLIHKSQNAPVPYPTILHSEQKCVHFCSEWSIVDMKQEHSWICEIGILTLEQACHCSIGSETTLNKMPK